MKASLNTLIYALALLFVQARSEGLAQGEMLPEGYRYIGSYLVGKRVKVREEGSLEVAMQPCLLRVFTDGISVRIYGEEAEEGFTKFSIYRNDGIFVRVGEETVETVPGLQARASVGDVMRQLTLTEDRLVLTKFPALSDVVEITYANRRISLKSNAMK